MRVRSAKFRGTLPYQLWQVIQLLCWNGM